MFRRFLPAHSEGRTLRRHTGSHYPLHLAYCPAFADASGPDQGTGAVMIPWNSDFRKLTS